MREIQALKDSMRRVVADHMDYASVEEPVMGPRASAISMSWLAD